MSECKEEKRLWACYLAAMVVVHWNYSTMTQVIQVENLN
jgi:hypothetical protein